jgi:hypothetical protein
MDLSTIASMFNFEWANSNERKNKFCKLYPKDTEDFIKYGTIGFIGLGMYQLFHKMKKRQIKPTVVLKDKAECIGNDVKILEALVILQSYRQVDTHLFKMAVRNIDRLLYLEHALQTDPDITPSTQDKVRAFSNFKIAINRLQELAFLIRNKMGNAHACVVKSQLEIIKSRLDIHMTHIFKLCSTFNPSRLIREAENILKNPKQYEKFEHNWDTYR